MQLLRTLTVLTIALTCAVVLAACGGETSKADYQKQVKAIIEDVEGTDALDFGSDGTPTEAELKKASDEIADAAGEIEDIEPPSEIADTHDDMVKVLRDMAKMIDRMAPLMADVAAGPPMDAKTTAAIESVGEDFENLGERMTKVEADFKKQGYKLVIDENEDDKEAK